MCIRDRIESVSSIQIPIINYNRVNQLRFNPMGLVDMVEPSYPFYPEPPNFVKPEHLSNKDKLSTIRLVGIYMDFNTAQNIARASPNRKLLGPGILE
jgi:hypothetical protein